MKESYYDPYSTKFLSEDPIGFKGGDSNLYRYVSNRPLIFRDPMGKNSTFASAVFFAVVWGVYELLTPIEPAQTQPSTKPPKEPIKPTPLNEYNPPDYPNLELPNPSFDNREQGDEVKEKKQENKEYYDRSCFRLINTRKQAA